ncbi:MAG TPA: hypothetical protein VFT97_02725, partial [Candidatus Eisenbacteria bacterium]|nr:hypothetical protein [Candidatus Eisenbacteria bacterium]
MAMPKMSLPDSILDYRMAGMMLLASGRDAEARSLIHLVPTFDHETAIATIAEILTDSVGERRADDAAMEAFGFEATDLRALKDLMNWAGNHGRTAEALRVASRIRELHPGDVDAGGWIERIAHAKPEDRWYGGN